MESEIIKFEIHDKDFALKEKVIHDKRILSVEELIAS